MRIISASTLQQLRSRGEGHNIELDKSASHMELGSVCFSASFLSSKVQKTCSGLMGSS